MTIKTKIRLAVIGTVGLPAKYGGFETLAENLVKHLPGLNSDIKLTVYCSAKAYAERQDSYLGANLYYVPLPANGIASILYDAVSILHAIFTRQNVLLILGTSGAIILPIVRKISRARIITNIDGIEWKRAKWGFFAKRYLRWAEALAVRFSDVTIADNAAIGRYVQDRYAIKPAVIAYGGDQVFSALSKKPSHFDIPEHYCLAICRIEPENNVEMILSAFEAMPEQNLIMIGNWKANAYALKLFNEYGSRANITLVEAIFDLSYLRYLRESCSLYIHGHSAGGTNPSLVEAMHFGKPICAFDCEYNRATTQESATYFQNSADLAKIVPACRRTQDFISVGTHFKAIAEERYTWHKISAQYFGLIQ